MPDKTANANSPRHLFDTGRFATLPPELQPYRPTLPGHNAKRTSPHLAVDGSKAQPWPTQDADPTRALQPPKPLVPTPLVEPPMTARDAKFMQRLCLISAIVVAVFGVLALVAQVVWGQP